MSCKSSSLSDPSSDDEFLSKGVQPYSHKPTFFKASVVYDSEHGLEEETDAQEEVDEIIANTKCCQCGQCYESLCY